MALTAKQKKFAENYALLGNARKCYIDAFPEVKNVESADSCAYILLRKPEVAEYIQEIRKQNLERIGDKFNYIAQQLIEDIEYRDEKGRKSATWAKSMQMLQNMYGFQQMKVSVDQKTEVVVNVD